MISTKSIGENVLVFYFEKTFSSLETYVLEIDLEEDAFTAAFVTMWIKETVASAFARRKSLFIVATRDINEGFAQANKKQSVDYLCDTLYYNETWQYLGYSYATDGVLSSYDFDISGSCIQIDSAVIDGSILKIQFKNRCDSDRIVKMRGHMRLERHKLV